VTAEYRKLQPKPLLFCIFCLYDLRVYPRQIIMCFGSWMGIVQHLSLILTGDHPLCIHFSFIYSVCLKGMRGWVVGGGGRGTSYRNKLVREPLYRVSYSGW
jgi:hypothetical protein